MVFNVEKKPPDIKPSDWRLIINGEVENPLNLSLNQLQTDFEPQEIESNILCLRGITIGGVWTGVPVVDLLQSAEVQQTAKWVHVKAYGKYTEPIKFKDIWRQDVILAYKLDGKPIPAEQGGGLRLIVPAKYAYKSVKWVKELSVLAKKPGGFWERKGYPDKDER